MMRRAIVLLALLIALAVPLSAGPLDVQVKSVRTPASAVTATLELRELIPTEFRKIVDDGGVLHLRVQAELWESRPAWDRLVYPAMVRVFRLSRVLPGRELAIVDAAGSSRASLAEPLPMTLDLGNKNRVTESNRYYVHVVATLGTLADREADAISDAVFGSPSESSSLGALGRLLMRTALQVSDYLQSVTAETTSGRIPGRIVLQP